MHDIPDSSDDKSRDDFVQQAQQQQVGLLAEFFGFLRDNKKWWLIPLIASLLLLGLISFFATTGAAPFIYTVF